MRIARVQIDGYDTDYIAYDNGIIINERTNEVVPYQYLKHSVTGYESCDGRHAAGFPWVELWFRREPHKIYVKELIAELFIPNPNGYDYVAYLNRHDVLDCSVSNLYWTKKKRHNNFMMITDEQAHEACRLLEEGKLSYREIAAEIGCDVSIISRIMNLGTYEEIARQYNLNRRKVDLYYMDCEWTMELRDKIDACIERGMKTQEICDELGVQNTYRMNEKIRLRRRMHKGRMARKAMREAAAKENNIN